MTGRSYLVTGDRGFVGSRLVRSLLDRGDRVVGVDVKPPPERSIPGYTPVTVNLAEQLEVERLVSSIEDLAGVFHLAARLPAGDDDPLAPHLESNLRPTENLLKALDGRGTPLVVSSTMSVYGLPPSRIPVGEEDLPSPTEAYGLSKLVAECCTERMARSGRVPAVVLRYSGIFGVGYTYGALHLYASRAVAGETIEVYAKGTLVRDYVHVEDVVEANLAAAEKAPALGWGLYHIGGGEPQTLLRIARTVADAAGGGDVRVNDRPGTFDFGFDITRARDELGYRPLSLHARIHEYVDDIRKIGVSKR